jgi:hypothetical protein
MKVTVLVATSHTPPVRVPVRVVVSPKNGPQEPGLLGMSSKRMLTITLWIWMFVVVTAVALQSPVPLEVVVQSAPAAGAVEVQFVNVWVVIVRSAALRTSAAKLELAHDEVKPPAVVDENPRLADVSVGALPTVPQLAADDNPGSTNAHIAITPAKSKTPFLEKLFISNTPCESRQDTETNGPAPTSAAYVSDTPRGRSKHACHNTAGDLQRQTTTCSKTIEPCLLPIEHKAPAQHLQIDPRPDRQASAFVDLVVRPNPNEVNSHTSASQP